MQKWKALFDRAAFYGHPEYVDEEDYTIEKKTYTIVPKTVDDMIEEEKQRFEQSDEEEDFTAVNHYDVVDVLKSTPVPEPEV